VTDTERSRPDREAAVVETFVYLADSLVDDFDVIDLLHFLSQACVRLIDIDEAAVMFASPTGHLQAVASSSERSRLLELFEVQNHDGPCLDSYRGGRIVTSVDLQREHSRWPTFVPHALDAGFHAVHSIPLRIRDETIGALNLFREPTGALNNDDQRLARALADVATVSVLQQRDIQSQHAAATGLQLALTSRIRIEQAKGIIAERLVISIDDAFEVLRSYARNNRLGLSAVAGGVVNHTIRITK
jgi:transcriptional regulator with GAF, ATPase, and Fis domain